jgi:hypothetical protein
METEVNMREEKMEIISSNVLSNEIPNVPGYVTYNVRTKCPHCDISLSLNEYPYDDDESQHYLEDDLGMAVFGAATEPANWLEAKIKCKCYHCKSDFLLNSLQT